MEQRDHSLREVVVEHIKSTGILPCIKLPEPADWLAYAQAMHDGGARVIEVTLTTPGALEAIETISTTFQDRLWVAAGTVLDAASAREVILHGGSLIVSPVVLTDVIDLANRYQVPVFPGVFTPTECLTAMRAGATMLKVFPAQLGGPKYMTNLRMVFPQAQLIPSGGVSLENAADHIRAGACAVSGARMFMNQERIAVEGFNWLRHQVARFIDVVRTAKHDLPVLP